MRGLFSSSGGSTHVLLPCSHGEDESFRQTCPCDLFQTIPIPSVHGRLDHMDVDVDGKATVSSRGLENGSVEVIDLQGAKMGTEYSWFQKNLRELCLWPRSTNFS